MADKVRRDAAAKGEEEDEPWEEEEGEREASGRERRDIAEESGEGASEAEGLVNGGVNDIWMP